MSVPQPNPALAAEHHREHQEEASAAPATSGEKIALHKIDATLTRTSSIFADSSIEQDEGQKPGVQKRKWYRKLNPLRLRKVPSVPEERTVCPEYGANILSVILFQWMSPLMNTGYLRPLQLQDIWIVNPNRSVYPLKTKLIECFEWRHKKGGKYPLLFAIYDTFLFEFWLGGVCQLFSALFMVFSPYMTRYLIAYATEAYTAKAKHQPEPNVSHGIGFAIGITVMQICQSLCTNQFIYRGFLVGAQLRAVLINVIFDKTMKISNRARAGGSLTEAVRHEGGLKTFEGSISGQGWSNGRIITLMSVDADRINTAMGMFHLMWSSPVIIILAIILLCINIGYSALSGFALLLLGIPSLTIAIKSLLKRRNSINNLTDQRVSLTQEILQSVRFVKFFGWESSFMERLRDIRRREIRAVQILLAIRNAILCVSLAMPTFASMVSFITYSLSQHVLTPAPIFSSLALFNSLRMPLMLFPQVLGQVTDAWTGLKRIQEFLLEEEVTEDIEWDDNMEDAIQLEGASFTWERTPPDELEQRVGKSKKDGGKKDVLVETPETPEDVIPFKISGLDLSVKRNELVAVIGTVGSGKTSLLAALAGDMRLTEGSIRLGASRAYCPQYAWIQNATVRENISFGKPYDETWYNTVVDACALRPDFDVFPNGDSTEIGERGITVSGGQKQRLNIARAIYFDSDIILMDDPLSAVDAHVGRHIMDQAICGLLKDKCRILATHQLHVLSRCDRIVVMDDGHINAVDTFDNLMRGNVLFQRLMSTTTQDQEHDKVNDHAEEETDKIDKEEVAPAKKAKCGRQTTLMQQEDRATTTVGWDVWKAYMMASGHILFPIFVVLTIILTNASNIMTSFWLTYWTSGKYNLTTGQYIAGYASLAALQAIIMFVYSTVLSVAGTNASKNMLQKAVTRVLRAPMSFFDTTPLGRITNRFSKDVHVMDNELGDAMRIYGLNITMITAIIILIIVYFHYFAIAFGPLLILFLVAANYYRASARDMKRFESVLRSHVFSRFSESISGVASIRAYGLQDHFSRSISDAIDEMDGAYFLTFSNQRWLSVRLDAVGYVMVFVTGILVVTSRFNVSPSISGLVLSYILAIVQMLQFTIRQLAEVENSMNATERLHYYGTQLEEEAPVHFGEVEPEWPTQGRITFSDVQMRYRAGLPLVLRGLNMDIRGGERIGIVGRTGAGKSSIMSALFRITELSGGRITIDGKDIAKIGLQDLRSRLAIIPQDPTLFRGTVRSNLDPFNEHNDLELWDALRKAHLIGEKPEGGSDSDETDEEKKQTVKSQQQQQQQQQTQNTNRIQLDTTVDEEGLNFSLGQRQLMALARALVRNSRIIICDEATSSVDFETDRKIQRTMATGFKGKTLLCIAHRLRTIITYDRICVMDQGQIAELDTPLNLWKRQDGIFRSMCDRSGIVRENFFVVDV
ncbi:ABC multidrug transporter, putative [Talaromyces stipitatus ATCC 10500]|uniref:ABC multidrug transporter, putative n=1 Tax=Talaromyces stipitatus (strain ATCC 10500 / CBS 375.48 / QM 6759 / NRRL 1006) TaxID=441959 RepID=B8MEA0_TALSN|nr:ABC multidrug transporter, putative [Talaromyces stipitatus ATCC 10500]EED16527.1 ABC multidrug transporter, putative [Talaromyces stipitatus ATCC 10500]